MVREQGEREDPPPVPFDATLEQFDPLVPVHVVRRDLSPGIASAREVVDRVHKLDSRGPGHAQRLPS